jgi:hypothetical protein
MVKSMTSFPFKVRAGAGAGASTQQTASKTTAQVGDVVSGIVQNVWRGGYTVCLPGAHLGTLHVRDVTQEPMDNLPELSFIFSVNEQIMVGGRVGRHAWTLLPQHHCLGIAVMLNAA